MGLDKIYGIKSVMKLKHYDNATSFVPWKRTIPHPNNSLPAYPKEKKKDCPISPTIPLAPPNPQDACDRKGIHIFGQHLMWN